MRPETCFTLACPSLFAFRLHSRSERQVVLLLLSRGDSDTLLRVASFIYTRPLYFIL